VERGDTISGEVDRPNLGRYISSPSASSLLARQEQDRCIGIPIRLRLEVDIESWNSELELRTANASCLDVLEFGIGNRA
jgi:hypothetical protein